MHVVCYEHGLLWIRYVMIVIGCECDLLITGLLWMGSVMNASIMNVVSYEHVY